MQTPTGDSHPTLPMSGVEVYCDLKAPLESKRFLAERPGSGKPFEFAAPS